MQIISGCDVSADGALLVILLPWRLDLPNRDRGHHWSKKNRLTKEWEQRIATIGGGRLNPWKLITESRPVKTSTGYRLKETRRKERRRVTITRSVAHARYLSKDADNLRYVSKPVLDSLKRLGLIYDDARAWIEHPEPVEKVSPDGTDCTLITIERLG